MEPIVELVGELLALSGVVPAGFYYGIVAVVVAILLCVVSLVFSRFSRRYWPLENPADWISVAICHVPTVLLVGWLVLSAIYLIPVVSADVAMLRDSPAEVPENVPRNQENDDAHGDQPGQHGPSQ